MSDPYLKLTATDCIKFTRYSYEVTVINTIVLINHYLNAYSCTYYQITETSFWLH